MRSGLLLLSLWSVVTPALAQQARQRSGATQVAQAVDSNVLRAHLGFLADDALEGRRPGTRGGDLAAKYIAAQFERLGLQPAGDSGTYFHRVPIITLTPNPAVKVTGPTQGELAYRKDYVLWSMRNDPSVQVSGDLVFVGYGIVAPEYQWDDYRDVDVKDKIVVALVNDPGLRDSTIFRGKVLTYYGRWTYKIEEARPQGAAGHLIVHRPESAPSPGPTVVSSWSGPQVRLEAEPSSLQVAGWLQQDAAGRLFSQA